MDVYRQHLFQINVTMYKYFLPEYSILLHIWLRNEQTVLFQQQFSGWLTIQFILIVTTQS